MARRGPAWALWERVHRPLNAQEGPRVDQIPTAVTYAVDTRPSPSPASPVPAAHTERMPCGEGARDHPRKWPVVVLLGRCGRRTSVSSAQRPRRTTNRHGLRSLTPWTPGSPSPSPVPGSTSSRSACYNQRGARPPPLRLPSVPRTTATPKRGIQRTLTLVIFV